MAALSNYLEGKIVDHFLRNTAVASPTTVYLALFESDPAEDASGIETAYTGYARQASTWSAATLAGLTDNTAPISFPPNANASAAVIITHAAIFDAVTAGNMLVYGALATPKTLEVGELLSFIVSALGLTLD